MPEDAPNVAIHVQSDHLFVSQDVAVPVAFLITELVELATLINPHAIMHISAGGSAAVESQPTPHRATLRVQSEALRSEEHTSELQSLMRISYAVFCLKKKNKKKT